MSKWIILDRDGVINHDSDTYIKSLDEWHTIEGSVDAIVKLSQAGFNIAVATNQSGLSRNLFSLDDLAAIHSKLQDLVRDRGGEIAGIFYCPHLPEDNCDCRKPKTGLLDAIESEFNTTLAQAVFVGDSLKDLQAGLAKGCRPVLVLTGKGEKTKRLINEIEELASVPTFTNLASFVDEFLKV